jgi:hypothetical protein
MRTELFCKSVLTFQKIKRRFHELLTNNVTTEEVQAATASIEGKKESQDLHRELLLSTEADNCTEVQGTSNYTLQLSPQQGVSLEQSAEEILSGVKKGVEVQYLVPVREEPPSETGMHILYFYIIYITCQSSACRTYIGPIISNI